MVRQVEVEKSRRSNMAHSSVNAPLKKGGAGGSYTWGSVLDITDYELHGFETDFIGVVTSSFAKWSSEGENQDCAPFDARLDDAEIFPCLPTSAVKPQQSSLAPMPAEDDSLQLEPAAEWVIVAPPSMESIRPGALDVVDGQHPRNMLAKRRCSKTAQHSSAQLRAIDWSEAGIPDQVKRQIIRSGLNASHRGLYSKDATTIPFEVLRVQNVAHNRCQRSSSRSRQSSLPRSRSKSLNIKQPNTRR
jgi:hypothetical protein